MKYFLAIFFAVLIFCGCTSNQRARGLGGNVEVNLPKNQKLITVTWKDTDLWYLTRPMRQDEPAESYVFAEDSTYGVLNGTVTLKEHK